MTPWHRLLCLVLTLLLALPAIQARACAAEPVVPHRAAPAVAGPHAGMHDAAMHHGADDRGHGCHDENTPAPAPAPAAHHDCIGCIAPIDRAVYRPAAAPSAGPSLHDDTVPAPLDLAHGGAPEPPPPRPLA